MATLIGLSINNLMPRPYSLFHDQYLRRYLKTGVPRVTAMPRGRIVPVQRRNGSVVRSHMPLERLEKPERTPSVFRMDDNLPCVANAGLRATRCR